MYDDDYEDDIFDFFEPGDNCVLYTSDHGVELGCILQITDRGLVFGRTHKTVTTGPDPEDWDFVELSRPILTFVRSDLVDRIESHADIAEENELSKFSELMTDVKDAGDFAAVTDAASDDNE